MCLNCLISMKCVCVITFIEEWVLHQDETMKYIHSIYHTLLSREETRGPRAKRGLITIVREKDTTLLSLIWLRQKRMHTSDKHHHLIPQRGDNNKVKYILANEINFKYLENKKNKWRKREMKSICLSQSEEVSSLFAQWLIKSMIRVDSNRPRLTLR